MRPALCQAQMAGRCLTARAVPASRVAAPALRRRGVSAVQVLPPLASSSQRLAQGASLPQLAASTSQPAGRGRAGRGACRPVAAAASGVALAAGAGGNTLLDYLLVRLIAKLIASAILFCILSTLLLCLQRWWPWLARWPAQLGQQAQRGWQAEAEEVSSLREQLAASQAQLAAAQERIAQLEQVNRQLRQLVAAVKHSAQQERTIAALNKLLQEMGAVLALFGGSARKE